jgi:hypothetical protein
MTSTQSLLFVRVPIKSSRYAYRIPWKLDCWLAGDRKVSAIVWLAKRWMSAGSTTPYIGR